MAHGWRRFATELLIIGLVAFGLASSPVMSREGSAVIADATSTGDPDFFWLPPTATEDPAPTGPFDAEAISSLVLEVCELDASQSACVPGEPLARFTSSTMPMPSRLRVDLGAEAYSTTWLTGRDHVRTDRFYRARVLDAGEELGFVDIDFVGSMSELADVDTTRYVGAKAGQQFEFRFRVQVPTARTRVKINEVESSGGVPGDWVELHSTASVPLSLAGYVIKDNDDTHVATLPAGATIPAHGFYVVEEAMLGFGLGGADAARFFALDGITLVDSYEWAAHAPTTYGRCPDGTGAFATNTTVTKGAPNDCSVVVKINEVESSGGTPGDWVELYNPGPNPADLGGFVVKDNDDGHVYTIQPGTSVPVNGFLVVDETSLGFGLGSADSVRVFRTDGSLADSYSWTAHAAVTYGRCPNGTGAFINTFTSTKGAANACTAPVTTIHLNEVESSGGVPGDWAELINTGPAAVDISGWSFLDNDDTHTPYTLPAGSTVPAGGYLVLEEAAFGFGLGAADSARLFSAPGVLYETYSWTAHATTTYGRCPNGTGAFTTTTSVTKGATNDCGNPVRINEVESSGGVPGDWIELINPSPVAVDLSEFSVKDNDEAHVYSIPAGTSLPGGGYLVIEEATLGFGLGSADSARLFSPASELIDSFSWTAHALATYGRCPNGTGAFVDNTASTKGAVNACPGDITTFPWPGAGEIETADVAGTFGTNMSGLVYEGSGSAAPGTLWAVKNGPGTLYRLVFDGTNWVPDTADGWGSGKLVHYADGTGNVDAEGVAFAATPGGGIYVSSERNNDASGVSRNTILRYDPSAAGSELAAVNTWDLTADLPVTGPNLGMEAITWVPDSFLTARGFFDESKSHAYNPAEYPGHGTGLFFVGLEANGSIYAYALDHTSGSFTRVATIASGFASVMDLHFDREVGEFWAVCDDTCQGRTAVLRVNGTGRLAVAKVFERPSGMPNLNNEGFAFGAQAECAANRKPVFWADDSGTDGHSLRQGLVTCLTP